MKKLKLKKKVKVITTLLSFGMLLTVLPSMKLVAEDESTVADTSNVSVGPYIKYEPTTEDTYYSDEISNDTVFTTLEADGNIPVVMDGETTTNPVVNEDGSYTYDNSVTVDKKISEVKDDNGKSKGYYKLDLSASSLSKIVNYNSGVDYILMLDVSKYMTEIRLNALKNAVKKFIEQVATRSSGSRIALISYSNQAHVLTSQMRFSDDDSSTISNADESALVTVGEGKEYLTNIVNGLTSVADEGSFSDYAMLDALKIFQDANNDDIKDGLGQQYNKRTRVSVLFTAGIPGDGEEDDNTKNDSTGWSKSARNSAQATMSMATIMKGKRGYSISVVDNSNVASGDSWGTLKNNYYGLNYSGCESTVYTVGLNLPEATNPEDITTKSQLDDFADMTYTVRSNGGGRNQTYSVTASGSLKVSTRQAALVNEFMYRVSSHRETGEHYDSNNKNLEDYFSDLYKNLGNNSLDISSSYDYYGRSVNATGSFNLQNLYFGLYYLYPDCVTRDLSKEILGEKYKGPYYLTATDATIDRLTSIFDSIAQQVGDVYDGLSVRDYIDSAFIPVNEKGVALEENTVIGETSTENGNYQGVLKKDSKNNWYIEWTDVKLSPESKAGANDVKTFGESIYVKPVNGMIGGNNLTTNSPASGIYIGEENKYQFPQPTVDIPVNYTVSTEDQNIYLTNQVNILFMVKNLPDGKNNKGVTMVYTVMDAGGNEVGQYTILPGESSGTWNEGFDGLVTPDNDQKYTITCTITTSVEDCDHSKTDNHHVHADVEYSTNKENSANINVFKPELTYKDLSIFYGENKPDYSDALKQTLWKHNDTKDTDATMNGSQPGLNLVYFDSDDASGNSTVAFPSKKEYQVGVNVYVGDRDITDYVSFIRSSCIPSHINETLDTDNKKKFIVHIDSGSLTINKTGGKEGETYVFKVKKDNSDYTEVSITVDASGNGSVTISELPIGKYSVEEDSKNGLAWRYSSTYERNNSEISSTNPNITIECKNTNRNDKWLNKISSVINNTFTETTE